MSVRGAWIPVPFFRAMTGNKRVHASTPKSLAAVFGVLLFSMIFPGGVRSGERRPLSVLNRNPLPPALAEVPANERFDHMLIRIDEDRTFFNYLLNIHIKIPALTGRVPNGSPNPGEIIRLLAERLRTLEADKPPPDPEDTQAVAAALGEKPFRQWLRIVGLLGAGKRAVNVSRNDDGGEEYFRFFQYSDVLSRDDPALFFAMVSEFCQFGARPPRSRQIDPIRRGRDSTGLFLPAVLSTDYAVKREPALARLVPAIIHPRMVESTLERIDPESWKSFSVLGRTVGLLDGFCHARIGRAPSGMDGVGGFVSLTTPLRVLRAGIAHEAFVRLPESRQVEIQKTLQAFENEAARRKKDTPPPTEDEEETDDETDIATTE